jgi:glycosyltransferase involved in cell wall biosynthesis
MPAVLAGLGDSARAGEGRLARLGNLLFESAGAVPALRRYLVLLGEHLQMSNADIIHSNGLKMHLLGGLARCRGIPLVWHVHDFYGLRPAVPWLLRPLCGQVERAVAISEAVAEDTRRVLPGLRVSVIRNAIDTARFAPGASTADLDALASMPPSPSGVVRIGLVATYARWKGHDVFLQAAREVLRRRQTGPPVRFYIIGGRIYHTAAQFQEQELRALAARSAVAGEVGFVPFQADPVAVYRALDVVVHASTQPEPFGLTIVEAMACGRPVIVARAGGAAELFTHGTDALGFSPNDYGALADAEARLVSDAQLRAELGRRARATAVACHDDQRLGPELVALYEDCVRPAGRLPPAPAGRIKID